MALDQYSPRPTGGLLLISPVRLAGAYEDSDPYAALRSHDPDDVIGNSILVFDLDRLGRGSPFRWPPPKSWPIRFVKNSLKAMQTWNVAHIVTGSILARSFDQETIGREQTRVGLAKRRKRWFSRRRIAREQERPDRHPDPGFQRLGLAGPVASEAGFGPGVAFSHGRRSRRRRRLDH